jgi:truncated hemoglobin YjbI
MDEDPDYYGIRKLHPADLSESRNKLFWFLSGWTGGPPENTPTASVTRFYAAATRRSPSASQSATSG